MGHRLFLVAVLKLVTCKALFEFCSETFHEELFPVRTCYATVAINGQNKVV